MQRLKLEQFESELPANLPFSSYPDICMECSLHICFIEVLLSIRRITWVISREHSNPPPEMFLPCIRKGVRNSGFQKQDILFELIVPHMIISCECLINKSCCWWLRKIAPGCVDVVNVDLVVLAEHNAHGFITIVGPVWDFEVAHLLDTLVNFIRHYWVAPRIFSQSLWVVVIIS